MRRIIFSLFAVLLANGFLSIVNAQKDISDIFKGGFTDLNTIANGYLKPAGNIFSTDLGAGWYNTAAVHKVWGFDLTVSAGIVQAPPSDQNFSLKGLTNLTPANSSVTQAPTFAGNSDGVQLNLMQPHYLANGSTVNPLWNNGTGKILSFTTPAGVSNYIPTASIQLTLGVPFINDVSIRFAPKVTVGGFESYFWGVGIKHNFKQWIPVVKDLPFDAAIVVAYTKFDLKFPFPASHQITPDKLVSADLGYIPDPTSNDYSTQGMKISSNAQTFNLVFSKKLAFITPYAGVGITNTSFDLTMTGNYPTLGDPVLSGSTYKMTIKNVTDPVKISSSEVLTNATVGLRLKFLGVIALHAQYAFQKYPIATAGFGFTFR